MVTKPTEKVWWICSSVQAGPSGPASALSKTQARVRVRAAALPLETIWSSCCRSSAARVITYFLFMAEVPVRKDRFPPLYGSLPTFQYNLDKALAAVDADLDARRGEGLLRPPQVAQALQQALGHVLQAAEQGHRAAPALLPRQPPPQAPLLQQLRQQVGDLQQVGVDPPVLPRAGGVLQVQPAVLLHVEALV